MLEIEVLIGRTLVDPRIAMRVGRFLDFLVPKCHIPTGGSLLSVKKGIKMWVRGLYFCVMIWTITKMISLNSMRAIGQICVHL